MHPSETSFSATLLFIAISFVLIGLNAFFVAAEFAIVKVRRSRLEELAGQGIASARISLLCVDDLDEYLSATQLGITLVSLGLGWIGEESFYNLLLIAFNGWFSIETLHIVAAVVSFSIVTLLHVVLGELVPKSLAIQKAEQVTLLISPILRVFYQVAKPVIISFSWLANAILSIMGLKNKGEPPLTEEELKIMMSDSHHEGVISESEARIINRAFSFSDKNAGDIMISIERVAYFSLNRSFQENMEYAQKKMYTRFPLAKAGIDDLNGVLGMVHMKDVLHYPDEWESNEVFKKVLRPAHYVSPQMNQDKLMQYLKKNKIHLAIVQDPSTKKNLGIVTMEDILEELVGDIPDEYGH